MADIIKRLRTSGGDFSTITELQTYIAGLTGSDHHKIYVEGGAEFLGRLMPAITGLFTGDITIMTDPDDAPAVGQLRMNSGGGGVISIANSGGGTLNSININRLKIGCDVGSGACVGCGGAINKVRITNCILVSKGNGYAVANSNGTNILEVINNMIIKTSDLNNKNRINTSNDSTDIRVANNIILTHDASDFEFYVFENSEYEGSIYFKNNVAKNFNGSYNPIKFVFSDWIVASLGTGNYEPFALVDGWSLNVIVNGVAQVLTFHSADFSDISAATADEVAAVMNRDLKHVRATSSDGCLYLEHLYPGRSQTLQLSNNTGTPITTFGFSDSEATGTGDLTIDLDSILYKDPMTTDQMIQTGSDEETTIFARDYTTQEGSPCIDAGDPTYAPSDDIQGNSRDIIPDIGVYEYLAPPPPPPPPPPLTKRIITKRIKPTVGVSRIEID
ncbi:MAG: choice-of-anchor Q domain-containing protein [Candidatus Woesearchaeota archaeon]